MRDFKLQPAHDLGLSHSQRRSSIRREPGLAEAIPMHLWWGAVRAYLRLYHRVQIIGNEHIPAEPPFILVANHTSHLDAFLLAAALPARLRRCTFPVSAGDVFFETTGRSMFSSLCLNALPMWRHHAGKHALQDLRDRLLSGTTALLLFPEGTRSRDGQPLPFKAGIGMLTAGTDIPVLPCRLHGCFNALPPGATLPRPRKLALTLGPPMRFNDTPDEKAGWQHIASSLQSAVQAL